MASSIWIAELRISRRTADKLRRVHHIDPDEVRQSLVGVPGLVYAANVHPIYGWRALMIIAVRSRRTLVVLFPTVDADVWNLGSAYHIGD